MTCFSDGMYQLLDIGQKMSFDKIFGLTASSVFLFFNVGHTQLAKLSFDQEIIFGRSHS